MKRALCYLATEMCRWLYDEQHWDRIWFKWEDNIRDYRHLEKFLSIRVVYLDDFSILYSALRFVQYGTNDL
jgi:hypothetical protein